MLVFPEKLPSNSRKKIMIRYTCKKYFLVWPLC